MSTQILFCVAFSCRVYVLCCHVRGHVGLVDQFVARSPAVFDGADEEAVFCPEEQEGLVAW
jgi:hypothetical protein